MAQELYTSVGGKGGRSLKLLVPESILQGYHWLLPGPPMEGAETAEDGGLSPTGASVSTGS